MQLTTQFSSSIDTVPVAFSVSWIQPRESENSCL